ncbi:hypothetical protein [Niabella aquatica]
MDSFEKDIQEQVEKQFDPLNENSADHKWYKMVFDALNEKSSKEPSYGFSFNVIRRIKTKENYKIDFKWNLLLLLAIALILTVLYITAFVYNNDMAKSVLAFVQKFWIQLLFVLFFYFLVQFIDKKTVIEKMVR